MKQKYEEGYHQINIDDISLDPNNPRHNPVEDDKSVLLELMKTKKFNEKIINLMKDILEYGQSPLDIVGLLLTKQETLYSKEGNRRVASLKILNNPNLVKLTNPKLYTKVIDLLNEYPTPPKEITCYITKDENTLDHAIELKHQGEQGGAGTVPWGANEKARNRRYRGMHDPIFAILDKLEDEGYLTSDQRTAINKTNWERIFTQDGQSWLGIYKENDEFIIPKNSNKFKIRFQLLIEKVIENKTHYIITNKEARKKLFDSLDIEVAEILLNNTNKKDEDKELSSNIKQILDGTNSKLPTVDFSQNNNNDKKQSSKGTEKFYDKNKAPKEAKESQPIKKENPKKFRLQELYVAKNSKISPNQHTAFINIHKELEKLSSGQYGFYKTYKLSTYYLIRALIEQCLKYWLSTYHPKMYSNSTNNNDAVLGKMIEQINKCIENKNDIFFDKTINKHFLTFFGNYTTKDTLDLLIHHPYLLTDDINILHGYTSGILFEILNYILTYEEN